MMLRTGETWLSIKREDCDYAPALNHDAQSPGFSDLSDRWTSTVYRILRLHPV